MPHKKTKTVVRRFQAQILTGFVRMLRKVDPRGWAG
jgi:hypothetical protein